MRLETALSNGGPVTRSPAAARERWGQSCAWLHLGAETPLTALVSEDRAPYNPEEHLFCWKDGTAKARGHWNCCIPSPGWGTNPWAKGSCYGREARPSPVTCAIYALVLPLLVAVVTAVWFSRAFRYVEKAEICPCWELTLNYDTPQTTAVQRGINLFIMMFKSPK